MFVISAKRNCETIRSTRRYAASATVFAMKLLEVGCTDVTIAGINGEPLDLDRFRQRHFPWLAQAMRDASSEAP